jgi:hypothetical protein
LVAISPRQPGSCIWPKKASASSIGSTTRSGSGRSATNTLRADLLRRAPPQSGQGRSLMYLASSSRTAADSVSR